MRRDLIIAIMLTFCLTASIFMVATSNSAEYDPWEDIDDDGKISIFDIVNLTNSYGATGNATKNVAVTNWPDANNANVTNWPRSEDILIWYQDEILDGAYQYSPHYYSNGYSKIHMRMYVGALAVGESCTFWVITPLRNANHTSYYPIPAYTQIFNSTYVRTAVTVDVPSDEFYFGFDAAAGTSCIVSLAFYMTWA
jgi:hypothetical protein